MNRVSETGAPAQFTNKGVGAMTLLFVTVAGLVVGVSSVALSAARKNRANRFLSGDSDKGDG